MFDVWPVGDQVGMDQSMITSNCGGLIGTGVELGFKETQRGNALLGNFALGFNGAVTPGTHGGRRTQRPLVHLPFTRRCHAKQHA